MLRTSTITIVRPTGTTAYAVGQRIFTGTSGITSSGSVFANLGETMFGNGFIVKAVLHSNASSSALPTTARLHLYTLSSGQTLASGAVPADQGTINLTYADASKYIGFIDFTSFQSYGPSTYTVSTVTSSLAFQRGSIRGEGDLSGYSNVRVGSLIGILEARSIFTPTVSSEIRIELTANSAEGMLTSST